MKLSSAWSGSHPQGTLPRRAGQAADYIPRHGGCRAILALDLGVDLFAVDAYRPGGLDAEADVVAPDLEDRNDDVVADDDGLVGPAAEDQHQAPTSPARAGYPESARTIWRPTRDTVLTTRGPSRLAVT